MISEAMFLNDLKEMLKSNEEISMETDLLDIEEWSSLSAMSFLAMAEEKYNKKIEPFQIAEAILVEDLYDIVSR